MQIDLREEAFTRRANPALGFTLRPGVHPPPWSRTGDFPFPF